MRTREDIDAQAEIDAIRFACRHVQKGEPYRIHQKTIEDGLDRLALLLRASGDRDV